MTTATVLAIIFAIVSIGLIAPSAVRLWKQLQSAKRLGDEIENRFSSLGRTTDEILGSENATNKSTVWNALVYRIGQKIEAQRSDTERELHAAYWVETEVNNGGFDQYFFNSAGDNTETAVSALKKIGAAEAAKLLERAMEVFPDGKPPASRFKRQAVMEQIANQSKPIWNKCETEFYERKENIEDLSLKYAKKWKQQIDLPC